MVFRILLVSPAALVVALGCAENKPVPQTPPPPPVAQTTSAPPPPTNADPRTNPDSAVNVSDEIRKACGIVDSTERAPKFDYDSAELTPPEKDLLSQVARCLTQGPLRGQSVQLVGRADPRGEQEYNMSLGARRAGSVKQYLLGLGVETAKLAMTSRGELDATGKDEEGWRKDRRVDIKLVSPQGSGGAR